MLMRENEEIRRQIAEVKNQMDQSMSMARGAAGQNVNTSNNQIAGGNHATNLSQQ